MRHRAALLLALLSSVGLVWAPGASAAPSAHRVACATSFDLPGAHCGTVEVPIDRGGKLPGTIELFYEWVPPKKGKSKATIAVFPGGPGAATSILGFDIQRALGKSLDDHAMLLLDQRGTGRSQYIDCDKDLAAGETDFLIGNDPRLVGKGVQRCAKRLGPKRSFFTTRDTVTDLEDVRQALNIDKL